MTTRLTVIGAILFALLASRRAGAHDSAALEIDFRVSTDVAATDCGDERAFRADLEAALGARTLADLPAPVRLDVSVRTARTGLEADLVVRSRGRSLGERTISHPGPRCEPLLESAVLAAALVLDGFGPADQGAVSVPVVEAPRPAAREWMVLARVRGGIVLGAPPGPAAAALVGVAIDSPVFVGFGVDVGRTFDASREVTGGMIVGHVQWVSALVRGGPIRVGPFDIGLATGASWSELTVFGEGFGRDASATTVVTSLAIEASIGLSLVDLLGLELGVGLAIPFERVTFVVLGEDDVAASTALDPVMLHLTLALTFAGH